MNHIKRKYMRFNNILSQKIRYAGLLVLLVMLAWPVTGQVQRERKAARQLFDVVLKVVDESGAPIPGASVVVGEGITHAVTDANGSVSFKGYPEDVVTINAFQYDKKVSNVIDIVNSGTITLLEGKIDMTSDDVVQLPFKSTYKRNLTGPELVVPGSWFSHYPTTDIRNSLTGISSMYDIRERDGSPGMSPLEGLQQYSGLSNSYGSTDKFSGMPYVIIDDLPAELQEYIIGPNEIESATLLKGILSTAMYGPSATGGVMYLKTRTGVPNERMLHVDVEMGTSIVDRFPEYVKGDVYATLQNQARLASDLPSIYSPAAIAAYRVNDGYDLQYPNTDFRDMMLDNQMELRKVNVSSSGGNDIVQYFSYLGYAGEGDIINMGAKSDYNRITARQSVNVKINDFLSAKFGFYGNLTFRRSPNYGYDSDYSSEGTGNATLGLLELPAILNDLRNVPSIAYPIWAYYDESTDPPTPWYGVSAIYTDNLIGNILDQGFYTDKGRTGVSNLKLTWDAGNLIEGLKSETYLGFNIHNSVRIGKSNDYLAYTVDVTPTDTTLTRYSGHNLSKMADLYKLMDYYFQRFMFYERVSWEKSFDNSDIQASAMYHQTLSYINGIEEPQRQRSILGTLFYNLNDKYQLQGVLNYAGNSSFAKDYRNLLNWAVGGAWIITDEDFMPEIGFVNYLKLRAQGGIVGNETYFPNLYDVDRWSGTSTTSTTRPYGFGPYSSSQWFGGGTESAVQRSYLSRTGNPALTWEKRREINAGIDAVMFDEKLTLGLTYYNWLVDGSISQVTANMPYLAGYQGARPYQNYNQTMYNALGADLQFNHKVGDVMLNIGANATTVKGIRVKYDEPQYRNDYQFRTDKVSDAIFGYTYLGKFASDNEAQGGNNTPLQLFDEKLYAGDLKYDDLNDDGFVDESDQSMIGHSSPRLYYGVNVSLKYKNFDLFILGAGRAFYDIALTNEYYWNGWGDNNYSQFVADNIGGDYPRLTYNKVNNNFLTSDYWLRKGGYFKIQNVELAYTIPAKMLQFMSGRAVRLYVRGANLLTLSGIKDVDPESIDSGVTVYPLFRTFSGGIKLNF